MAAGLVQGSDVGARAVAVPSDCERFVLGKLTIFACAAGAVLAVDLVLPSGSMARQSPPKSTASVVVRRASSLLQIGSRGAAVRSLQAKLARLSYLPRTGVDGVFGMQTWHAVVAFQGWSHLARDGIAGPRTFGALAHARRPAPWSTATGFEIHISEQVLLLIRDRRVERAIHVSSGAGSRTPLGHFRIYSRESMSWSVPFHVWMPLAQYFYAGYAMHEFGYVPAYPASHGCVRIPSAEARAVWKCGRDGMRVWTRR